MESDWELIALNRHSTVFELNLTFHFNGSSFVVDCNQGEPVKSLVYIVDTQGYGVMGSKGSLIFYSWNE